MRRALIFILVGCSGPAAAAPAPVARGGACHADTCADGLVCAPQPQGYCLSGCEVCGDGACVDTWHDGPLCLARCTSDRDCRADEGYLCDASWHACMLPNSAAIVPRVCAVPAHDPAFAAPEVLTVMHAMDPTAALARDGHLVVLYAQDDLNLGGALKDVMGTQPRLARMANNDLAAIWSGRAGIELATSPDGRTWTEAPRGVQDPGDDSPFTDPAIAPGYALYASHDALRIRTLAGGTTVTPIAGTRASALVSADHRLHVVSLTGGPLGGYGSADQRVEYTVSRDGKTFAKPLAISGRDEELPWFGAAPTIALDERRNWLYIAYVRGGHDARWDIVIVALQRDKIVKRAVIGDGCALHMAPSLAVDPTTGALHVAFYDSNGYAHAVCTPGSCKLAGTIATFPVSTARTGPRALGDRAALILDDKHRLLHAVWAQPDGIFHATGKL